MKKQYHYIGCSAYNNKSWVGVFYPEDLSKDKWFEFYSNHFKTYEINTTFYRFPTLKSLQDWYHKSPEDFLFSVKVPQLITHTKQFTDCRQEIEEFYSICHKGLGTKLGCVLFQIPATTEYTAYRLALILSYVNLDFSNVIEFRNESWWRQEVYDALSEKNIAFCNVSYPKLPTTLIQTTDFGYFRLHGISKLYTSGYSDDELEQLFGAIKLSKFAAIYVSFNNTASKSGILNAIQMRAIANRSNSK